MAAGMSGKAGSGAGILAERSAIDAAMSHRIHLYPSWDCLKLRVAEERGPLLAVLRREVGVFGVYCRR